MKVTLILDDDRATPSGAAGTEARADVLRVAGAVEAALVEAGHAVTVRAIGADLPAALTAVRRDAPDAVFNLCESVGGDARGEAAVAGALEQLGLAVTGSPALALGLALHKDLSKALLRGAGVPTPDWFVLPAGAPLAGDPAFPVIVKPAREDGSIGIDAGSVAGDRAALEAAVDAVWDIGQPALVERYVDGREVSVSFLGNAPRTVLPLREITFGASFDGRPRVVTYQAKWDPAAPAFRDTTSGPCDLPPEVAARAVEAARRAFDALGCRDYGRVDLRLDAQGTPWVIDLNPNCDLHPEAGFARAAAAAGIGYGALIATLLENALERSPRSAAHRAAPPRAALDDAPPGGQLHRR
jgi:D-alanine-D-alanine ligase